MPPLPVIAGVSRVTLNYAAIGGVSPRNVLHFSQASGGVTELRDALDASWQDDQAVVMLSDFEPTSYDILPLDGTTPAASFPFPSGVTFCDGSGDVVPEAAAVMSFRTSQRGPRGRGRCFVGPCSEGNINNGQVTGSALISMPDAWNAFQSALNDLDVSLVVASYVHEDANVVTSLTLDHALGTQRRRLLQQRA